MAGKKHQNGRVSSGDKFMEGTSTDDIEATLKKERYTKTHLPLLACLARRDGGGGLDGLLLPVGCPDVFGGDIFHELVPPWHCLLFSAFFSGHGRI